MTDLFADKALEWDTMPLPQAISLGVGRAILAQVALREDMEVMDFGAGTGLVATQVAPRVRRIWAVDVSAAMLEKLAAKPELAGRVQTVCQDILVAPLARRFDLIVSAMAMHHVADTVLLMHRFAAHLRPGGRIAVADLDREDGSFHPPEAQGVFHHGFERDALAGKMRAAGFEDITFHDALSVTVDDRQYPIFLSTARLPD